MESLAIDIAKKEAEIDKQDGVIANLEAKMAPHEEAAADCEARLAELNEEKGGHAAKQNKRVNHLAEIETSIKRRTKHLREQQAVGGAQKGAKRGIARAMLRRDGSHMCECDVPPDVGAFSVWSIRNGCEGGGWVEWPMSRPRQPDFPPFFFFFCFDSPTRQSLEVIEANVRAKQESVAKYTRIAENMQPVRPELSGRDTVKGLDRRLRSAEKQLNISKNKVWTLVVLVCW